MNKMIKTVLSLTLVFLAQTVLACDYPQRASVPDGNSATKEEMIAGQKSVKAYVAAMEEYLSCIEAEETKAVTELGAVDEDAARQRADMFNKKYNAAIEEMNRVAEEFNVQVRAYKSRSN